MRLNMLSSVALRVVVGRPVPIEQVFVFVTGGRRYLVVADGMRVVENDLPFMQSSLERAFSP